MKLHEAQEMYLKAYQTAQLTGRHDLTNVVTATASGQAIENARVALKERQDKGEVVYSKRRAKAQSRPRAQVLSDEVTRAHAAARRFGHAYYVVLFESGAYGILPDPVKRRDEAWDRVADTLVQVMPGGRVTYL